MFVWAIYFAWSDLGIPIQVAKKQFYQQFFFCFAEFKSLQTRQFERGDVLFIMNPGQIFYIDPIFKQNEFEVDHVIKYRARSLSRDA